MCGHVCVVCVLLSWQFLRWQCRSTSGLYMQCGVCLYELNIERVYDDSGDVHDMFRW